MYQASSLEPFCFLATTYFTFCFTVETMAISLMEIDPKKSIDRSRWALLGKTKQKSVCLLDQFILFLQMLHAVDRRSHRDEHGSDRSSYSVTAQHHQGQRIAYMDP